MLKVQSPLIRDVQNTLKTQNLLAQKVERSNSTGMRNLQDMAPADLMQGINASVNIANLQGVSNSIESLKTYAETAGVSINAMAASIDQLLGLANAAVDPSRTADLPTLDTEFAQIVQQMQSTVSNTHDALGNLVLDGSVATYAPTAAANIALIAATGGITTAADANAANLALQALGAFNLASLGAATSARLNDAANISLTTTGGGFASTIDYISRAMSIIPTIGVDPVQISTQLADAIRSAQLATLMKSANGPIQTMIAANAAANGVTTLVACMLNTAVVGNGGGAANAAAPIALVAGIAAQIAALLTPAEKASLTAFAFAHPASANAAQIAQAEVVGIFGSIQCFTNLGLVGLGAAGAATVQGGTVPIVAAATVFPAGAQTAVATYITNAAVNRVTTSHSQTTQVSPNGDTFSLKIDDMSPNGLGLGGLSLTSAVNAQTAIASLTQAAAYIATAYTRVNNQVTQLEVKQDILNTQVSNSINDYQNIMESDPIENAGLLTDITNSASMATVFLTADAQMKSSIAQAAKDMLRA